MREDVIRAIRQHRLIVIARGLNRDELLRTAEAMYKGGVRLLEVPFNACGDPSDETTADCIAALAESFKGRMYIGSGTVLTERQVELTRAAGGQFIISPNTDPAVIEKTRAENLVSIPGAMTPTEAVVANRHGADFVKLFPMAAFPPSFVKALCAPLSNISFVAVGGVNTENALDYIKAGAVGIGVSSAITDKAAIREGRFDDVTKRALAYTSLLDVQ